MSFKSKVTVEDAVYVNIHGRREVPRHRRPEGKKDRLMFETSKDLLARRFLEWLCEHPEIDQFRGGSCGMGSFVGWFPAEHKDVILQWIKENT